MSLWQWQTKTETTVDLPPLRWPAPAMVRPEPPPPIQLLPQKASCPGCAFTYAAVIGRLGETRYDATRYQHNHEGDGVILKCARCLTDYCVAGGQVWRWGEGAISRQPPSAVRNGPQSGGPSAASIERSLKQPPEVSW